MAINVSFNGATIYKPGSYSKTIIDLGGGFPLGPAGLIAVIGEADAGAPGSKEVDLSANRFSADQLTSVRSKYRSGPIADSASLLFAPAADSAIPGGAQTVWFYKTNESIRATLVLAASYGTVRALEWGVGGNKVSVSNILIAETPAQSVGAAFNEAAVLAGSIAFRVNGGALVTQAVVTTANNAALVIAVAAWSVPGLTFAVSGVDGASVITVSQAAAPTQYTMGWGRSFEVISSTTMLALGQAAGLKTAAIEPSATITIQQTRDGITESDEIDGAVVMTIGHDLTGGVTSASVSVTATAIVLTTNLGAVSLPKAGFVTLRDVAAEINLASYGGWSAAVAASEYNQLSAASLDDVSSVGAASASGAQPVRIKKDASSTQAMLAASSMVELISAPTLLVGLPAALSATLLAGGAKGATTPASIVAALEKFEKFHVNAIVPLFSRDATADALDSMTDSGSTYTIDGVHQAVKTHISLMKTTKKRSERQGYLSLKKSYATSKSVAGDLGDGRISLVIQDIRQADASGVIRWMQPCMLSCLMAGARGGAPIGEPMTFKFMNCSGVRHTAQAMSTADANIVVDFDPDLKTDEAIQAGITFLEHPQAGGFRVVVDNTTYGVDGNFVWNRANVIYASDIVAFNFRNTLESVFVGKKNTVSVADIAGVASSILNTFLAQGITVSTTDAPQGFKQLVVRLEGNTIFVEVTIKIVEGIDFVLSEITIQRATA